MRKNGRKEIPAEALNAGANRGERKQRAQSAATDREKRQDKRAAHGEGVTITGLAWRNNRSNRTRSILVTVSVALTTLLLVLVSSYGYGLMKDRKMNAGLENGSYYAYFRNVSMEQIRQMRLRSEFQRIGVRAVAALTDQDDTLQFADSETLELSSMAARLEEGAYPEAENEIAASRSFFERYGVQKPSVGDTVTIEARTSLEVPFAPVQFVISGIMKEDTSGKSRTAFLSQGGYESLVPGEERQYSAFFTLDASVPINTDSYETTILELGSLIGVAEKNVVVNGGYLMWALDPGYETVTVCAAIILCVVFVSVIVIYNIFQVGIQQKIQEYGKVRALGATRRQMRRLIWREGMTLAAVGIPLGLAAGVIVTKVSFSWFSHLDGVVRPEGSVDVSPISFPLLALSALICFLTVWASLKKPMRTVASLSPVEAIRYQENGNGKKRSGLRRGRKEMTVFRILQANLSAQRLRTASTILTMGLSCTLFLVLANLAGNMDAKYDARKQIPYGDFQLELDYSLNDTAYPEENLNEILKDNPIDEALIAQIRQIDGVSEVRTQKILAMRRGAQPEQGDSEEPSAAQPPQRNSEESSGAQPEQGDSEEPSAAQPQQRNSEEASGVQPRNGEETVGTYESVVVMDRETFELELKQSGVVGDFSYDSVSEADALIYGWSYFMEDDGVFAGDEVQAELESGMAEYACKTKVAGSFGSADATWVMTEDTFAHLGIAGNPLGKVWITCEHGRQTEVARALRELLDGKEHVELEQYEDVLQLSRTSVKMMRIFCYALSAMIAFISFMNMTNTLIVNVITRRQEFGMLQAIGMTNAQLGRMLRGEGLLFTAGTVLVAMAVGVPCGYAVFRYGKIQGWIGLYEYHFPVTELLFMVVFLALFQTALSLVLTRSVKRESVIDRIRYQG